MELLLINQSLDCPICDQDGECDLWHVHRAGIGETQTFSLVAYPISRASNSKIQLGASKHAALLSG
jgi:predicted molibdopterin-dependent oxidoreductase YjgC